MSRRWSFAEKRERGVDFLRYLRTDGIELSGQTKGELRRYYVEEYKNYRSQFKPGEQQIPYSSVIQTLFTIGRLHLRGIHLYHGPAPEIFEDNIPHTAHNVGIPRMPSDSARSNSSRTQSQDNRRRRPHHSPHKAHSKIAVDQHITYNKPEATESNTSLNSASTCQSMPQKNVSSPRFDPEFIKQIGNTYDCSACNAKCTSANEMSKHIEGRRHRMGILAQHMKKHREKYICNKYDVEIAIDLDTTNGTVFVDIEERKPKVFDMKIINHSEEDLVELLHCEMLKRIRVFQLDDEKKVTESQDTVNILPGTSYTITVRVEARNVGSFNTPVAFHFRGPDDQEFHIIRFIHAKCKNQLTEQLQPTKKYKRPPRVARDQETVEMVKGYKLPRLPSDSLEKDINLASFQIPNFTRTMINRGFRELKNCSQAEKLELSTIRNIVEGPLTMETYQKKFSTLLYIEEIQMEVDIRKYDMEAVPMTRCPENFRLLLLEVPGLAENRPSVLIGDWLYVRQNTKGKLANKEYQGFVHEVRLKEVALGFDNSLVNLFVPNMKFNVRFVFNRLPLKLQHRACALASEESLQDILFPTVRSICTRADNSEAQAKKNESCRFFNLEIEKNREQKEAVQSIYSGTSRPAPYIVFGPPGTGKTVTIVESMKQIYHKCRDAHILACTPSNSAADLLVERLLPHVYNKGHLLRLNAMSRSWRAIPDKVKDYCNYNRMQGMYFFPRRSELKKYRIIVCTLVTAGRIASANFPSGHFTHVFIDEAGHAVEPEALIPVAGVLNCDPAMPCGQLVLAGDPQQLGPILRSPWAIKYGLDISLLERYMSQCPVYQRRDKKGEKPYNNKIITKLLKNYRSHPAILEHPNKVFYNGELERCAGSLSESLCNWEKLPRKNFPLIFHGVSGQDMREERSPSFFNADEAIVVFKYVCSLLKEKKSGVRLSEKDIGIISPYRKQCRVEDSEINVYHYQECVIYACLGAVSKVQKIQSLLRRENWNNIQVGSVEEFQGQERLVIIVSTVRSNPEYLSLDMTYKLGFLKNPKRFNVTITRAKALMIVVGDPRTLSLDPHWKGFIEYCCQNKAYTGVEFSPEEEELDDIIDRLNAVNLKSESHTSVTESRYSDDYSDFSDEDDSLLDEAIVNTSKMDEKPWRRDI